MSFYIRTKLLVTTKLDSITLVVMHHLSAVTNRLLVILRNAFVGKASTRFTSGRRLLTSDRYLVVGMLMQFISIIQCYAWGQDCATYFAPATSYKGKPPNCSRKATFATIESVSSVANFGVCASITAQDGCNARVCSK